ncbi:MAG TPA: DmsC/YnfH family molybdoenzyme membrane anchor subunit [Xanthobacteraceae bacterium]|jgi:DMSO reductase anchor subunit|nr:DmsC/YnfH family molybdoenzyme membrane anchor subunit [Xanthobacteraceae bacterium]
MHPAFSIIFFTAATGAGSGLLAMLGTLAACSRLPPDRGLGLISLGIALGLIAAGLMSSTLHLGHPERAWRAFSQWRSSWLSREGIASLFTFVPTGLFGIGWILFGRTDGIMAAAGVAMAAAATITVVATGMIYASLKPIAQWSSGFTLPAYLIFALMTGAVLLNGILTLLDQPDRLVQAVALVAVGVGWIWKVATWRHNDRLGAAATLNSATGLAGGVVRSVEWPHTEENYLLKEMGYRVARKHAARLRLIAQLLAFGLPLLATALAATTGGGIAKIAVLIAVLGQAPGILVERWLFFAEAKHTVRLYYGLEPAGAD